MRKVINKWFVDWEKEEKWMQQELEKILHREKEDEEGIRIKETN